MDEVTEKERELRKKAVFDGMSERHRRRILQRGYERWDPFMEPKDPIDIRKDKGRRTSQALIREFLQSIPAERYDNAYARGAFELCLGIINEEAKSLGMFDFACWYRALLEREDPASKA